MVKPRCVKEIAVDPECHTYHRYSGFVGLMQMSSRGEGWIMDLFGLGDDLGDLVNRSDTFHASKVL
jgi:exosome complex exonuclease RRP6